MSSKLSRERRSDAIAKRRLSQESRGGLARADPQVAAREMVVEVDHPKAGRMKALGFPVKFTDTPATVERAAPLLGQHTDEILATLGYDAAAIARLRTEGAVR